MEWSDDGIVLFARKHGETAAILECVTRHHGRHVGLVYGGASAKRRALMQPGNVVRLNWRARLSDQLGFYTVELLEARAHLLFAERASLMGLNAFCAMAEAALPEREPHEPVFDAGLSLLSAMAGHGFADWGPLYVRWEMGLLDELGFGLDRSACAATGSAEDLIYISPRSGRAVSREAGAPYQERLLRLPGFLGGAEPLVPAEELAAGLALTGYFLLFSRVLEPHGAPLPPARARLNEMAVAAAGMPRDITDLP